MSLEVIEVMIKESLRDGVLDTAEKENIVEMGESFGISKETVIPMIEAEVEKFNNKVTKEAKEKKEQEIKQVLDAKEKRKKAAEQQKQEEAKQNKPIYKNNYEIWIDDDIKPIITFGLGAIIGLLIGVLNAYTHSKGWSAYIGMPLLGIFYGLLTGGIAYGISLIIKRKPTDWHKPVIIAYGVLVLGFICYLVIPF